MKLLPTFSALLLLNFLNAQDTRLLREPTLSDTHIVFVHANDLWRVSRSGGEAVRLTSNEGHESLPHFSPDGKQIAFTAEYEGNTDVYLLPSEGGSPRRLTWHPAADYVQGWSPDGKILFRSNRKAHPTRLNKFYTVDTEGNFPEEVAIPRAAYGELSEDGSMIAYVPITFWDPEWRNYRGGQAMPIWIVDMETKELQRTPQPTGERHLDPVWYKGKVFYISERDYAANIWSYDPKTAEEKQHTFHTQFDVKSLDAGNNGIVYEQGGYLHFLDPDGERTEKLSITVRGDMNFSRPRWEEVKPADLSNANISPTGQRAIFEYRGEIISVPREKGSWRNLTNTPGIADRSPVWSPKGDKVAWFTDADGEYKLQIADQFGNREKLITLDNATFYFEPAWSPDGTYLAFTDTDYNIITVEVATGKQQIIATDRYAHPNRAMNPVWSPDSKWIAYSRQLESHFKAVFAHNIETGKTLQLTEGIADCITPVWDAGGKYLYFLGSTDYGLNSGWLDMSSYDPDVSRNLYCLVLSASDKAPILPESDEETAEKEEDKKENGKDKKKGAEETQAVTVKIDENGLWNRIIPLQLQAASYTALFPAEEGQVFISQVSEENPGGAIMHLYDVKKQEAEEFAANVNESVVSSDRKHILLRQGESWGIYKTKGSVKGSTEGKLSIDVRLKVDPRAEYHQIFREGWRFMRDFLYVDNVHGAPWDTIYEWYSPWIDHVKHRTDLNYVVDIMSGEVSVGHSYVSGGDMPDIDRVPVGLLGCDLVTDRGRYRIDKIYDGGLWNPGADAPLALPGLNVNPGDYLLSINGRELEAADNPYRLLEQTAGRTIQIEVSSSPEGKDRRKLMIKPVSSERSLRTIDWIESNRKKVDELSGGKLAYVYVPNTSGSGFTSFNRYYFSQQDKKGVIIDERNNGGGSAADYMIDIMSRQLFGYFNSKTNDHRPWTTPMAGIWGPKVMIINERAGSGGDLLPYMFRAAELGPLVGTRTWGGLVGTWDTPRFIDGGRMVAPRGGFYDIGGEWAVEGEGVAPDIEVIQTPAEVLKGRDPQLERAVEEALRLLEGNEFEPRPEPDAPIRWKRPETKGKE
ncbi:S41 family peptidase [Robertkochia aurantiaca]|uniref:S41 family peptidase n=1 Tax=Robertkochia aurantiaca TaxID=2873700 RepID=UPI001CCC59B1|nr:S41 family peptidase [Robertkochia sp. 3YJGBD-33]